jgi:membrane protease YdiL (CAAX protease family)
MSQKNNLFYDENGIMRSGLRVLLFLSIFIVGATAFGGVVLWVTKAFQGQSPMDGLVLMSATHIVWLALALGGGWVCGGLLERLPMKALGASFEREWATDFAKGSFLGLITFVITVIIVVVAGGASFSMPEDFLFDNFFHSALQSLGFLAIAAAWEEALFRGYILQTLARSGFAWPAIIVTALLFGLAHAGNPDVSPIAIANTVLAGIWFGLAYLKTRNLWFVFGLHLFWNWTQGAIFGIEISGLKGLVEMSLLIESDNGPAWLTGGTYGIEGGIACTIAILFSMVMIWRMKDKV